MRVLGERQQRRQRALVLEPLQRERHRPPAHARLTARRRAPPPRAADTPSAAPARRSPRRKAAAGVSRRTSSSSPGGCASAPDCDDPARPARRSRRRPRRRRSGRAPRRRCPARAATDRRAPRRADRARCASPSRPSANAAIWRTSGSASASTPTSGGTPSASPTRPIASAARRRMRASSSASSRSEIGRRRRRRRDDRRRPLPAHRRRAAAAARRRRRIAQHALILEPEDPRHLLFEGRAGGGLTGAAGGALAQAAVSDERQRREWRRSQPGVSDRFITLEPSLLTTSDFVTSNVSLSVAASIRSSRIVTPMPGAVRHRNRAVGGDLDRRLDEIGIEVALAGRDVAGQREIRQRRQMDVGARPMPDSSMPPCHTGMPCDGAEVVEPDRFGEPADPARLDVDDAAGAGGDRLARDADAS